MARLTSPIGEALGRALDARDTRTSAADPGGCNHGRLEHPRGPGKILVEGRGVNCAEGCRSALAESMRAMRRARISSAATREASSSCRQAVANGAAGGFGARSGETRRGGRRVALVERQGILRAATMSSGSHGPCRLGGRLLAGIAVVEAQ